jgi:ElaA protein
MKLNFKWSRIEDLSSIELFTIIKAREAVFVVEQECPYQETDEMDLQSWHLVVSIEDQLVAYVRVVDPGIKYEHPSIGRVMTCLEVRHLKIGRPLMKEAIRFTEEKYPNTGIKIGAQVYLQKFYESLGFAAVNEPYDEDGILHIDMIKADINEA